MRLRSESGAERHLGDVVAPDLSAYGIGMTTDARLPLWQTADLRAFRVPHPSDTLVVTFSHYVERAARAAAFGAQFLDGHAIDAIHVVADRNGWFLDPEMAALLAAIGGATAGKRVIAYGSSMGGYAAIRFAGALGAQCAVALSPQYALGRQASFDRRWPDERRKLRFPLIPPDPGAPPAIIFYDPHNPDARHAAAWQRVRTVIPVPLPYAGHPAGTYLAQVGLLGESLLAIIAERFDAAATAREAWARRRRSAQYLARLAAAQPGWRRRTALALAARAAALAPASDEACVVYANLLYRAGREAEAEEAHRAGVIATPEDALALFRLSRFLQRTGRYAEALPLAQRAARADPGSRALARHAAMLLCSVGSPLNPRRTWARATNLIRHRLNRIGWRRGWPAWDRLARP